MTVSGDVDFMTHLPKAELHVHLEGTMEPADMFAFAQRNGIDIPWRTEQQLIAAYEYEHLDDFLELLWAGCRVLLTRQDFHDLTLNYLRRARAQGVTWAEMSISPQSFLHRGVEFGELINGITDAIASARSELGIDSAIIVGLQRHRSESEALELLDVIRPYRDCILGIGLGGPEAAHPPSKFAAVFAAARNEGYRLTAHAGEEGPPSYVREALEVCRVDRIDHGNSGIGDPRVRSLLHESMTPLTLCPLSNMKLKVVDTLRDHPVRAALDAGLIASIHSDDPAYFGGYIADNYRAVAQSTGLLRSELLTLAANSFRGSFADSDVIAESLHRLDIFAQHTSPD